MVRSNLDQQEVDSFSIASINNYMPVLQVTFEQFYKTVVLLVVTSVLIVVLVERKSCNIAESLTHSVASLLAVNNTCGESGPCTVDQHY